MKGRLRPRAALIGAAIAAVLAVGTTGFILIEGYSLLDAFYMALTTMTTVGYGEIHPLSPKGRIFNVFLISFGVTVMFLAIGAMTQTIIEWQFGEVFEKRRTRRMIDKLQNHYIVCGFGRVGRGAAAELKRAGVPFVVVDQNPDKVERAVLAGMLATVGDSTRDEVLLQLRITHAKGLIAALATDADNLFVTLSAKSLNPLMSVAARAGEEQAEQKLRRAGADSVLAPYNITGSRLAQSLLRPHVTQFLEFTTQGLDLDIGMEQVRVGEGSDFVSQSLRDMQLTRELGVIVLAIRRADGQMLFNPPADAVIAAGDYLIVMGKADGLRRLERLLSGVTA